MKKIVVGISGAETSQAAARQAVELAAVFGASVHFVTAVSNDEREVVQGAGTDRWEYSTLEVAKAQIADFVRSLGLELEHTVVALEGPPAKMLIAQAENIGADLIVVGNVRMQGIGRVLGSVGNDVAHHAPCNVLIVKTV